jgi:hypothetical protein
MKRYGPVLTLALAVVVLAALVLLVRLAVASSRPQGAARPPQAEPVEAKLARSRRYARRLERIVRREVTRAERNERSLRRARHNFTRALGTSPFGTHPLEVGFLCIHRYEGSWRDPGLPYFGGLQMDLDFQRAYGREYLRHFGTADRWPVSVQLAVAIHGWIHRGYSPWPNTRRSCGL